MDDRIAALAREQPVVGVEFGGAEEFARQFVRRGVAIEAGDIDLGHGQRDTSDLTADLDEPTWNAEESGASNGDAVPAPRPWEARVYERHLDEH